MQAMSPGAEKRARPDQGEAGAGPIDHAYLSRYTFGNRDLELEVLRLFADQAPEYLEQLREAESEKSWHAAAHTIKGSARAVGALVLAGHAEEAEALKGSSDLRLKGEAVARVEEALREVRAYIDELEHAA